MTRWHTARAILISMMLATACPAATPVPPAPVHQIPRVVGLAVTKAVSEPRGDYEAVQVVAEINADSMVLVRSGEAPDDDGVVRELAITRQVSFKDLRESRVMRTYFHSSEFRTFPGTSPVPTAVMINELRATGRTRITHLDVQPQFGMTFIARTLVGDLVRVGPGPVDLPVLVNGQRVPLRTLHVKGHLVDGDEADDVEYFLLDDPDNPLFLQSRSSLGSSNVVKIEFPVPPAAAGSMEQQLKKNRKALVYGIYFSFASADIRPVSERVLKEIAQVMKSNPDWKLRIDGHTDNIGGDKSNLELSRRRAAAVMDALVRRYAIAAARLSSGGYGASQPQEKNDTPEGRARNRRVELTRE
jgi:outer membrane protein OmpA-like peptidoglycan-associated protein